VTEARLQEKLDDLVEDRGNGDSGNGDSGNGHAAPAASEDALATILRQLADAPPEARDRLVWAARAFGPDAVAEHGDLLAALTPELRRRLLRPPLRAPRAFRNGGGRSVRQQI
jgi:hypothetical protein